MQKNKSFQKPAKSSKQFSNTSSKALLQLSQITTHSKEKSNILQNLTGRSGYQALSNSQNSLNEPTCKQIKQNSKLHSKKQNYIRKNISLSNTVLKQIMQMSDALPTKNLNFQSSRTKQNENDLIIFSKQDIQKGKNNSQTKKSKKLLLYENKQSAQKGMSKSKSYYGQAMKGEGILCSIKIHPMDEQRGHNFSSSQKRESFDAKRSSFGSRRSSIHLFPQEDFNSEYKMKEIRKSFLAKLSVTDGNISCQQEGYGKVQNFLKKQSEPYSDYKEQQKQTISKKTSQNDTQITPREKRQTREKYLYKLDELNLVEDDIKKDASQFIQFWDSQIQSQKNLKKYQKCFTQVRIKYDDLLYQQKYLNSLLFEQNKRYVMSKRMSNNNYKDQRQGILLEVQKMHLQVKKKVFKKDLEDMMIFNMKVVLPSSQMIESSVSCFENHINSTLRYGNITILQLYEEMMSQKACKKYGMILKKQINNMNIYDNRTMNEYLRKLYELEQSFHKVHISDPQRQVDYLDQVQDLVEKIEQAKNELSEVRRDLSELQRKIKDNQRVKQSSVREIQNILNRMSQAIYSEYKIFQTGGKNQTHNKIVAQNTDINQSFCENDKTVEEFKELVTVKYQGLYIRYKQVKEERKMLQDSLKIYE